ncbi:hypothetical protein CFI00_13255 [Nocardioides sp. S5]|uniref:hypothetical protein n=1 Tax=Nocardioides sp. S5 TaxID=2017486 RepID=UPI001A8E824D|nr:hypothetical protein [Nocardioides sp. S5]QSR31451.1 hypothetical protein CFI00_13255 [Nocardioides sp. S5]
MTGWVYVGIISVGLIGWTFVLEDRIDYEHRLATWWLDGARGLGVATGPVSFIRSTLLLAIYCVVAWLGDLLATGLGHPLWALLLSGPAMLAYAPVVLAMAPLGGTAYRTWRSHLAAAGADPGQQRAIAWGAGPPALAGFGAVLFTLFTTFGV